MTIVVTGATGHLGRLIVESLLARGVPADQIVGIGRQVEKIADLAERGVVVAHVDYDDMAALDSALTGADTVVLVSGSEMGKRLTQHIAVIDAAKKAGASRLIYTSVPDARESTLTMIAADHKATEEYLDTAGITFTILRNGFYHENYFENARQALASGVLLGSAGTGTLASVARADLAEAAAIVASSPGHDDAVYELSGDTAWSFHDLAAILASISGKPIEYQELSSEEHAAALAGAGVDEVTAGYVLGLDATIREGLLSATSEQLPRLLGRPTASFEQALRRELGS